MRHTRKEAPKPSWFDEIIADTVVVHTKDDRSIKGILVAVTSFEIVLSHARIAPDPDVDGGVQWVDMDGEQGIPRENIAFLQRLTPGK